MKEIRIGNTVEQCVERADYPPETHQGRSSATRPSPSSATACRAAASRSTCGQRRQRHRRPAQGRQGLGPGRRRTAGCRARRSSPLEEAAANAAPSSSTCSPTPARRSMWPKLKPHLTKGKALYFSHGFSSSTATRPASSRRKDIDVILVAPKGSGTTVRRLFLEGKGINASFAIHQDATGRARDRCLALGIAIGSGYLFETTFQKEVVQRPDRRARRAHGRDLRPVAGAVRGAARARPLAVARRSTRRSRRRRRACTR